jgi:hypothetical protein
MVNIKYYIDGKKVLENEYQSTSITNLNTIIESNYLDKNYVYEVVFTRHYMKSPYEMVKTLYLVYLERWMAYEKHDHGKSEYIEIRKYMNVSFAPLASLQSQWKLYFNKKSDLKFVEVKNEIVNTNSEEVSIKSRFQILLQKEKDLERLRKYNNHNLIMEVDKMTLNGKDLDGVLRYEDFLTQNVLVRYITIVKAIIKESNNCVIC